MESMHSPLTTKSPSLTGFISLFVGLSVLCSWPFLWADILRVTPSEVHQRILSVTPSPDHKLKAVVFEESLRPEDKSINVSILRADANLGKCVYGNLFCDWGASWARVNWQNNNSICITHAKGSSVSFRHHFKVVDRAIAVTEVVPLTQ